jgi:phosphatidylglycerol---prolipoprotein diacylglyceryl transferase
MSLTLVHLYGPFSINSYGLTIALGLLLFMLLIQRHPRFIPLKLNTCLPQLVMIGIISGVLGGRVWYALSEPSDITFSNFFAYWQGGLSILGCIISLAIVMPVVFWYYKLSVLPVLDLVALYSPLLQSISRFGCLFAGCCYGTATKVPWAIVYTNPDTMAPLCIPLHPTQIYSSIVLLIIFLLFFYLFQYWCDKPGQLLACYLIGVGGERFFVDFFRADRQLFLVAQGHNEWLGYISINQLAALGIMISGSILLTIITVYSKKSYRTNEYI